jgi:hypothetical protein
LVPGKCQSASPELSADWGTRFLSSQSGYYDASSYNNGAVWPFLTGFSSLALYNYGNPYHGFSLLQANLNIIMDYDYGAGTELLSGDIYRPLDQSVPDQIWSSGNTISAFVEGLLGFEADALQKEIRFKPAIPLIWPFLKVNNLMVGQGNIGFNFKREKNRLEYVFDLNNLKGYTVTLEPEIPAQQETMTAAGVPVSSPAVFNIAKDAEQLVMVVDISGYVYPYVRKELEYGDFSKEAIIENFQLHGDSFTIDLWGKGSVVICFYTDCDIECPGGVVQRRGNVSILTLKYKDQWERKSVIGKIKKSPGS